MRTIGEWADEEGYHLLDADDPGMLDGLRHPLTSKFENVYLVSVRDKFGRDRQGRVLVGHWLMVPIVARIRVQWINS